MTPSLKLYDKILNRLDNSDEKLSKVYGIVVRNTLTVLSIHLTDDGGDLVHSFPAEIDIYGILKVGNGQYDAQEITKLLSEIDVTDNPVFINYNSETKSVEASFYKNGRLEETECTVVTEQEVLSQFLYVRLQAHVPLFCSQMGVKGLSDAFLDLRKSITSGEVVFNFKETNVFLLGYEGHDESGVIGISGNPGVGEFCDDSNDLSEGSGRKKKSRSFGVDLLDVEMLKRSTGEIGVGNFKNHAPICVLDKKKDNRMSATIKIDSLSLLHRETKVISLYNILVESALRNLKLQEQSFLKCVQDKKSDISMPEVFHFYPQSCGHFFTKVYLKCESDADLTDERLSLHKKLLLPLHQPLFRKANSYLFKTDKETNGPLFNPHEGVKNSGNEGKVSLVKGKYQYYHYCQNKMDDNGWGCAYRSLQTLASWFKCQGYVDRDVPTFDEIQQCLVDIGDKPSSFVGSKQWIGSTEVSYVLGSLLNITSKILYVSSGDEMASKGPELVNHFDFHGTPVMIGGGVYAHTILGVDYNSQTGGLKFLVLDPHYTGSEDLNVIQNKGWCGWKGCDFWDKTAYYNMCLPQVPLEV